MGQTLEQFAAECHDVLSQDSGPTGLEQVRRKLETMLVTEDFVAEHLGPDKDSPRNIIYQDPELGFCIIAHVFKGESSSPPHDHASAWAIYGQVKGVTEMTEWRMVRPPEGDAPGKVEAMKTYELEPGMAVAYDVGKLHSPRREGDTRLIRIEGRDLSGVERDRYEPI